MTKLQQQVEMLQRLGNEAFPHGGTSILWGYKAQRATQRRGILVFHHEGESRWSRAVTEGKGAALGTYC